MAAAAAARSRDTARARSAELRMLDHEREITPDWLQREQAVGYVTYVDRFAGTLAGVRARLPYLRELGVTYLHLMPLLRARPAPNDGGYAVVDYGAVEPALGTIGRPARAGDATCARPGWRCASTSCSTTPRPSTPGPPSASFYRTFPDRSEPDAYERTLPEVFPDTAPGSFTRVERPLGLDDVQRLPVGPRLHEPRRLRGDGRGDALAGRGRRRRPAPGRRAVPVEAAGHELPEPARGPRAAAGASGRRCGSPRPRSPSRPRRSSRPRDLVPYLGTGKHEGKECDLAYHNVLMVLLWSALASGRVALMTSTLRAMPPVPPGAGWLTYVRCHDDIGWAITPEDAGARRRGRVPAPALPGRLLRRRVPGHVRARRALPARPAHGRGADVAGRARRWRAWRARPTRSRSSWRCGGCCCCTRSRSRTAGCR